MSFTHLKNKRRRLLLSLLSSQSVTYGNEPHKSKFLVLFQEVSGRIIPWATDVACTQTFFFFFFISFFSKTSASARGQAQERERNYFIGVIKVLFPL